MLEDDAAVLFGQDHRSPFEDVEAAGARLIASGALTPGVALPFGWIIFPSVPIPAVWNKNIGSGCSHILPQKVRISRSPRAVRRPWGSGRLGTSALRQAANPGTALSPTAESRRAVQWDG